MPLRYYKAAVEVLVIAESEAEACDALAEGFRPMLMEFEPKSSWIDWRYLDTASYPQQHDGAGFEYVEAGMPQNN